MKLNSTVKHLNKEINELLFSLGIFAFFALMIYQTFLISNSLTRGFAGGVVVDATTYPKIFCGLGLVLSLVLIIQNLGRIKKKAGSIEPTEGEIASVEKKGKPSWVKPLLSIILAALFIVSVNVLGVIVGGWLYLLAQIAILLPEEKRGPKAYVITCIISFAVPLAVYLPFRYIFYVMFPLGIFKNIGIF